MNVGFLGLGVMGAHMAENLARAGHEVAGTDLRKVELAGVRWAASAAEAAAEAEVVFTSLPGPKEVEALAPRLGDAMQKGAAWFDLTTNSPACVRRVHAQLRSLGVEFLDAPVSGGKAGAQSGRLAIWVGGESDAAISHFRRERPPCGGQGTTLIGTGAADQLTGTDGPDVIAGLGGNDVIRGLAGNDVICGGKGRDRLVGGPGSDRLLGQAGRDLLKGGSGRDRLKGGPGRDVLRGGPGRDRQIQ